MLTSETKKHIDSARQVLVGVVPNPSSQIDQITNALIYKFMDDMDQMAIKAGGKASFFTGDLERYAWTRLMDTRLGNQERMNLYSEALTKFGEAKQLPELFRDIFKRAFLPHRSPEVLGLFLKEIAYFDYVHSEELGNAFEYLLSIMGSQGDAGQFRTPRHIIDFIVEVLEPSKSDRILDPACGTAGFLISAYKHILARHDGKNADGTVNDEKPLTASDKVKLTQNFEGYDVSPEMVRLSKVNMYLHQFKNPNIYEYNTLAQEERWNDKYDIILANPPFMTPKGGMKTHSRFSIQATKSEVLFVDYIVDHLRPKGRAGIIVPEGIIFQSGIAYKQLRKKLVKDGLWAVVSLPSGVFNPYAGVKTSVLLFDNERAKQTSEILFVKIENDGYDLGAQRRPVQKNDLPEALQILSAWKDGKKKESSIALYVERSEIAGTGEYNLSSDRYLTGIDYSNTKWQRVPLSEVFVEIKNGKNVDQFDEVGRYRVSRIQTIAHGVVDLNKTKYTNDEVRETDFLNEGDILFSHINSIEHLAKTAIFENTKEKVVHGSNLIRLRPNFEKVIPKFALYQMKYEAFIENAKCFAQKAVNQASINTTAIKSFEIPLPPLEVQEQIVEELDGYQNIITGAKQIVENWKPKIDIDPTWEKVKLGDVCDVRDGTHDSPKQVHEGYPLITSKNIKSGQLDFSSVSYISEEDFKKVSQRSYVDVGDIIMPMIGTIGGACLVKSKEIEFAIKNVALFKKTEGIIPEYLLSVLDSDSVAIAFKNQSAGSTQKFVSLGVLRGLEISLPPLEIQKQIVEKIETERVLVESSKKLIDLYEQKTKDVIAKLWSE